MEIWLSTSTDSPLECEKMEMLSDLCRSMVDLLISRTIDGDRNSIIDEGEDDSHGLVAKLKRQPEGRSSMNIEERREQSHGACYSWWIDRNRGRSMESTNCRRRTGLGGRKKIEKIFQNFSLTHDVIKVYSKAPNIF
ncbi:hypothetical protein ACH5RR_025911 [Cinchona calisaya]|uniref:Uncharacterized protein n=1 Tax=Cinchona calisaya TaxID=153742 RepID=A0ABD2Z103_9GENT